jgi:hypothetical protein
MSDANPIFVTWQDDQIDVTLSDQPDIQIALAGDIQLNLALRADPAPINIELVYSPILVSVGLGTGAGEAGPQGPRGGQFLGTYHTLAQAPSQADGVNIVFGDYFSLDDGSIYQITP